VVVTQTRELTANLVRGQPSRLTWRWFWALPIRAAAIGPCGAERRAATWWAR
jgi:hypothetical protein